MAQEALLGDRVCLLPRFLPFVSFFSFLVPARSGKDVPATDGREAKRTFCLFLADDGGDGSCRWADWKEIVDYFSPFIVFLFYFCFFLAPLSLAV